MPPQCGTDVVVGTALSGSQVDRRVPAHASRRSDGGGSGARPIRKELRAYPRRVDRHRRQQVPCKEFKEIRGTVYPFTEEQLFARLPQEEQQVSGT